MTVADCPVIDLRGGQANDAMAAACAAHGYFALQNHGIPDQVLDDARAETLRFIERPFPEKMKAAASANVAAGYVPPLDDDDPRRVALAKDGFNLVQHQMEDVLAPVSGAVCPRIDALSRRDVRAGDGPPQTAGNRHRQ